MQVFRYPACAGLALALAGCAAPMTPEQQTAADRQACASYGFTPGTDRYAECMMQTSQRREDSDERKKRQRESIRQLSIQRNGDPRFPVCGAAMPDASLDIANNKWFGADCREQ